LPLSRLTNFFPALIFAQRALCGVSIRFRAAAETSLCGFALLFPETLPVFPLESSPSVHVVFLQGVIA
jgi:hypothetical protein